MSVRTFVDAQGVEWTVWSVRPRESILGSSMQHEVRIRPQFVDGWLAFRAGAADAAESVPYVVRRLAPIPADWEVATDAELGAYLGLTTPAPHPLPLRDAEGGS